MSENTQSHQRQRRKSHCHCHQSQCHKNQWTPTEESDLLAAIVHLLQNTTLHQESDFWNAVVSLLPKANGTFRSASAAKHKYQRLRGGAFDVRRFLSLKRRRAIAAVRRQERKEKQEAEDADIDVTGFTTDPEENWMDDYTGVTASGPAWDDEVREVWGEKVRDLDWKAEIVVSR